METIEVTKKKHRKFIKEQGKKITDSKILAETAGELQRIALENMWGFFNKYYPETKSGRWSYCHKTNTLNKISDHNYDLE